MYTFRDEIGQRGGSEGDGTMAIGYHDRYEIVGKRKGGGGKRSKYPRRRESVKSERFRRALIRPRGKNVGE